MAWQLLDLMMLAFGAVIVATALVTAAGAWLIGEPLAEQFEILRQRLPAAVDAVMQWLNSHRIGVAALQ